MEKIDRAIYCLYPVYYAVNGKIDRAFYCHFPVHYAVNGKIDRAIYCLYPVYYAVNASMDRDLLLYIKVHCLYWRTMKSGRAIMLKELLPMLCCFLSLHDMIPGIYRAGLQRESRVVSLLSLSENRWLLRFSC